MAPLAAYLRSLGYEVHTPTLAGHGGGRRDMRRAAWQDWVNGAETFLVRLLSEGKQVHIMGFSMGGLIAAHLAAKYPVLSLTMLSSPIYYVNKRQILRTAAEALKRRSKRGERGKGGNGTRSADGTDYSRKDILRYAARIRITPLKAVLNFRELVRRLKTDLPSVTVPALIIQGERDDLVQARSARYIYDTIGSRRKRIHFFRESRHMICLGSDREEVSRLVADFIAEVGGRNDESETAGSV